MDWRRKAQASSTRMNQRSNGNIYDAGIFQGTVQSASGENQVVKVLFSDGERNISLPMPFDSTTSWIRSIPESGQQALLAYRSDNKDLVFLRYLDERPDKKIDQYKAGRNNSLYRPILPGEHEIQSSGGANIYLQSRPILEMRGGAIRSWLDQDRAEAGQKAPLHTRQLHEQNSYTLLDEERFGVVKRSLELNAANASLLTAQIATASPSSALGFAAERKSPNFFTYPYPDFSLPGGIPALFNVVSEAIATATEAAAALTGSFKIRPFAKEYTRIIKNPLAPLPPTALVDIREGQVFDDDGIQTIGPNGAYLRAQYQYYTALTDATACVIDEIGNVNWDLSLGALTGWTTSIPFGGWKLSTGLDVDVSALTNIKTFSLLSTSIEATTELNLNSTLNTSMSTGLNFEHTVTGTYSMESQLGATAKSNLNFDLEAALNFTAKAGAQMALQAPIVAVGQSPSEPMVMGTQLSTWLQTLLQTLVSNAAFIGTGNLGAPVPLNPAILAVVNQLLAQIPLLTSKTITLAP